LKKCSQVHTRTDLDISRGSYCLCVFEGIVSKRAAVWKEGDRRSGNPERGDCK